MVITVLTFKTSFFFLSCTVIYVVFQFSEILSLTFCVVIAFASLNIVMKIILRCVTGYCSPDAMKLYTCLLLPFVLVRAVFSHHVTFS